MAKLHPSIAEKYPDGVPAGTCLYQSNECDENGEPYLLAASEVVIVKGPMGPEGPIPGHVYSPMFGYVPVAPDPRTQPQTTIPGDTRPPHISAGPQSIQESMPREVVELEPVLPLVSPTFGPHACPQCLKPWVFKRVISGAVYRCTCGYEFLFSP